MEGPIFTYQGQWRNGLYHGEGSLNSKQYSWVGEWRQGKKHGTVKITDLKTSESKTAKFDNGRFCGWEGSGLFKEELTSSIMRNGEEDNQIWSENGNYGLKVSSMGKMTLRKQGKWIWDSEKTAERKAGPYTMQLKDGNLAIFSTSSGSLIWGTNTSGNGPCALVLRNDGEFEIFKQDGGDKVWGSGTEQALLDDVKDVGEAVEKKLDEAKDKAKEMFGKIGF